jgi:hypothetical protein
VRNQEAISFEEIEMKYGDLTFGQMEAIVNKLGGLDGVRRFLADEITLALPIFPVWKTIRIGVHKNLGALNKMLSKFRVSDWAKDIMGKSAFTLSQSEEEIPLCSATVKELTGKNQATTTEIFDAIRRIGELLPAEVGPALREQYLDQPDGEWLRVAMEPICGSDGDLRVFNVERDGGKLWLNARYADPAYVWDGDGRFVFRSRK